MTIKEAIKQLQEFDPDQEFKLPIVDESGCTRYGSTPVDGFWVADEDGKQIVLPIA